jgi:hypothetical protein
MTRSTALAIVCMFAVGSTVWAQQPAPRTQANASRSNPYSRLFQTTRPTTPVVTATVGSPTQAPPQIKCGMTVIQGDANIDPGIHAPARTDATRYTIRVVEPTVCR